jgi:hypothetical protein
MRSAGMHTDGVYWRKPLSHRERFFILRSMRDQDLCPAKIPF